MTTLPTALSYLCITVSLSTAFSIFAVTVAFAVLRTLPALVRFYRWFKDCGLEIGEHRGYGQTASKAFGFIPAPKLSVSHMGLSGAAFAACLLAVAALPLPGSAVTAALLASLAAYHLFFSQLYCEAHVGAHVTVMIPPAILLVALSAARTADDEQLAAEAAAYTAWLCKIILTSSYCSAGLSKLWTTMTQRSWVDGATLQAFIFEATLMTDASTHSSFGLPTPFTAALQSLFLNHPRLLLAPMAVSAVAFEALAPLVLLAPPSLVGVPFALFGVSFHYGIAVLQNIDFVSWWGPMYAFFLVESPADASILSGLPAAAAASYGLAPVRTLLAGAYVALHLAACVVLRFYPRCELLPFSCFPMFKCAVDLFDPSCRKWHWLTEKPHATGTLKNYAFPLASRGAIVRPHELDKLPFKYCLVGHGGDAETVVMSNAQLPGALRSSIDLLVGTCRRGRGCGATDPSAMSALQQALLKAKAAFAAASRSAGVQNVVQAPRSPASITEAFGDMGDVADMGDMGDMAETPSTEMIIADETAPLTSSY